MVGGEWYGKRENSQAFGRFPVFGSGGCVPVISSAVMGSSWDSWDDEGFWETIAGCCFLSQEIRLRSVEFAKTMGRTGIS